MLRTSLTAGAMALAVLALGACDGDDPAGDAGATTDLEVLGMDGLEFEPTELTVPAGEEATVELTAEAGVEHDFVIEDVEGEDLEVAHADPGETDTGSFAIDEAGTYDFYCAVPGHREAGMEGTVEVVEDA